MTNDLGPRPLPPHHHPALHHEADPLQHGHVAYRGPAPDPVAMTASS